MVTQEALRQVRGALQPQRLLETALRLIEVPSPTRSAGAVADRLAELLRAEGFSVERPIAGWPTAPAVAVRWESGRPGRVLQFNAHLDTVHLPFVPPRVEAGKLYGSGAADMKGGLAAAIEALRILRDGHLLPQGGILLTAHDLHESPWGDGSQVDGLINDGYVGDGVLLPEYLCDRLPVAGRGGVIFQVKFSRPGAPLHEVLGGKEQPDVIAAGADFVLKIKELDARVGNRRHPLAGSESAFVGQAGGGEIYNQSPTVFQVAGTRRWLVGTHVDDVRQELLALVGQVAGRYGVAAEPEITLVRDAYEIDPESLLAAAFQAAHQTVTGAPLPLGGKPFVDDGNTFVARASVPAITHGPRGLGAHTLFEEVALAELERVAVEYALTAMQFCPPE